MPTVAVLEAVPALAPLLSRTLPPSLALLSAPDWQFAPARRRAPDLLVLGPDGNALSGPCLGDGPRRGGGPRLGGGLRPPCRILLAPGGSALPDLSVPSVVSYGPSRRDTLTVSSLRDGGMVLALQREVVTLTGRRMERQELALPVRRELMLTLAWAGTLLLAGAEPEALPGLARRVFL